MLAGKNSPRCARPASLATYSDKENPREGMARLQVVHWDLQASTSEMSSTLTVYIDSSNAELVCSNLKQIDILRYKYGSALQYCTPRTSFKQKSAKIPALWVLDTKIHPRRQETHLITRIALHQITALFVLEIGIPTVLGK